MIQLLRQLRQQLIKENRMGKYFLYAIGEIILVVIGILIALSLNNQNDIRKTEAKIDAIFKGILEELTLNIEESRITMLYYHKKDSVANIVLFGDAFANPLSREAVVRDNFDILWSLPSTYKQVFLSKNNYAKLVSFPDEIPAKYDETMKNLYVLHNKYQQNVELLNEEMRMNAFKIVTDRVAYNWYSAVNEEQIYGFSNYVLNDIRYKNEVKIVYTSGIQDHLQAIIEYRNKAVECYQHIAFISNSVVNKKLFGFKRNVAEKLVGIWESEESPGLTTNVFIEHNTLFYNSAVGSNKGQIIFLSNTNYITTNGVFCTIIKHADGVQIRTNEDVLWTKL